MRISLLLLSIWIGSLFATIIFSVLSVFDLERWTGGYLVWYFVIFAVAFGVSFLIGLILWIIVLKKESIRKCLNCGNLLLKEANFCKECGLKIEE